MNETNPSAVSPNPFRSRRVRPGAMPFLFPQGQNAEALVDRLRQCGWRAEIVGEHGSGKSALLAALIPEIERAGRHAMLVELHDGQRRLPSDPTRDAKLDASAVLILDGYEQLRWWSRWKIKRWCHRRGAGLLITTHKPTGLPELYRTAPTLDLAGQIVAELLGEQPAPFSREELADCYRRHRGNLREMLFDLYDRYEDLCPIVGFSDKA